jgi:hypothetical protein
MDRSHAGWSASTPQRATAWLETERSNLHAAAEHAAACAVPRYTTATATAISNFLLADGHWDQSAALYRTALAAARQAGDRPVPGRRPHPAGEPASGQEGQNNPICIDAASDIEELRCVQISIRRLGARLSRASRTVGNPGHGHPAAAGSYLYASPTLAWTSASAAGRMGCLARPRAGCRG